MTSRHYILTPVKWLILILLAGGESKARNTWKTKAQQLESYPFHTGGNNPGLQVWSGDEPGGSGGPKAP